MKPAAILLLLVLVPSRPVCGTDLVERTAFVIDGDTIEIDEERIRLHVGPASASPRAEFQRRLD